MSLSLLDQEGGLTSLKVVICEGCYLGMSTFSKGENVKEGRSENNYILKNTC